MASASAFYIKFMRFVGFLRLNRFLECHFVNFAVHLYQDKEQSNTEMFLRVVPFILLYLLEGKKRIVVEGEGEEVKEIDRFSITGRMVFHILFILLSLSLLLGCFCISMASL